MNLFRKTSLIFAVSVVFLNLLSCNKDTTCIAKIKCKDSSGNAVNGARVNLYAMVENENKSKFRADIQATGVTDNSGEVTFSFDLPAIFDIGVSVNTQTANAIIKLEEGKTTTKEVRLP